MDNVPLAIAAVSDSRMLRVFWACIPSHATGAGAIHPLRRDVPGVERRDARARASDFNSIAEVMALS